MINLNKTAFLLAASVSFPSFAQTCLDSIEPTHQDEQYVVNTDGTVTDVVNGFMWTYCSVGETFNDLTCSGTPENFNTWQAALVAANNFGSFAGYDDWRLPNIKELSNLVERSCYNPAINLAAFPSTVSAVYWSNTIDSDIVNDVEGIEGRLVDFTDGTQFLTDVNTHKLIRMVRDIK